ncbi:MAG TPA: hypothetical protein VJB92_03015 [Candidatus Paceibacterota bacterium]
MQNYNSKFKIFTFLSVILIFTFLFLKLGFRGGGKSVGILDAFAQCLTDKGAVMYGADWCPHCQNEKKAFGDSFRFINYVECPKNPNACLAAGVEAFPTWFFPDGKKFVGEQGIEKLGQLSNCETNLANKVDTKYE